MSRRTFVTSPIARGRGRESVRNRKEYTASYFVNSEEFADKIANEWRGGRGQGKEEILKLRLPSSPRETSSKYIRRRIPCPPFVPEIPGGPLNNDSSAAKISEAIRDEKISSFRTHTHTHLFVRFVRAFGKGQSTTAAL